MTGANGFLGSHIVKLFFQKGVRVSCLVREKSNLAHIEKIDVKLKYGDIRNQQSLIDGFKGYNFVIHNAAHVKDWGDYQTFYQTNVEGTLNVLNACLINGIKDVIFTGTNSVYGEEHCLEVKDENSPHKSHYQYFLDKIFPCKLNYYRDTKCIATQKAFDFAKRKGINLTILEPVWVYGENGNDTVFLEYIKSAEQGMKISPGSLKNKFHVVYAGDVAQAYYLAFLKQLKGVERILIGNHECESMDKIFALFCDYAKVRKPKLLPKWMVYPLGFLSELLGTIFNFKNPPLLTRGRVNMFYDNIEYSPRKAKELIGFKSQHRLSEGIKKTVNWYRKQVR